MVTEYLGDGARSGVQRRVCSICVKIYIRFFYLCIPPLSDMCFALQGPRVRVLVGSSLRCEMQHRTVAYVIVK